jgi:hypothetical protein
LVRELAGAVGTGLVPEFAVVAETLAEDEEGFGHGRGGCQATDVPGGREIISAESRIFTSCTGFGKSGEWPDCWVGSRHLPRKCGLAPSFACCSCALDFRSPDSFTCGREKRFRSSPSRLPSIPNACTLLPQTQSIVRGGGWQCLAFFWRRDAQNSQVSGLL